jgi:hypothetical protein
VGDAEAGAAGSGAGRPVHALVTDIDNDLLSGFSVAQLTARVQECLARLATAYGSRPSRACMGQRPCGCGCIEACPTLRFSMPGFSMPAECSPPRIVTLTTVFGAGSGSVAGMKRRILHARTRVGTEVLLP